MPALQAVQLHRAREREQPALGEVAVYVLQQVLRAAVADVGERTAPGTAEGSGVVGEGEAAAVGMAADVVGVVVELVRGEVKVNVSEHFGDRCDGDDGCGGGGGGRRRAAGDRDGTGNERRRERA